MPAPGDEAARLGAVGALALLNTPRCESFDRITRLAAHMFRVPVALLSLVDKDRVWFLSATGFEGTELPRCGSMCAHVVHTRIPLVVPDARMDARFASNALVTCDSGLRFYAGVPLLTRSGHAVGTLCLIDQVPRELPENELRLLLDLAAVAATEVQLHGTVEQRDRISGLPNRARFMEDLAAAGSGQADGRRLVVVVNLADAVRLTNLLATLGADRRDELIRLGAAAIQGALPAGVTLYHVGSARFAFILPERGHAAALDRLAEAMRAPVCCGAVPVFLDVGIGAAPYAPAERAPLDTLRMALAAAQRARDEGESGSWLLLNEKADRAHRRAFQLLTDLRPALNAGLPGASDPNRRAGDGPRELDLHYQPRIDLRTGRCNGAEALLRWQHPTLGGVPPSEFIPLVEKTALPRAMTEWVLEAALFDAAEWRRAGLELRVSVNVCVLNLSERDFAPRIADALARHNLPASMLELELTESALLHGTRLRRTMREITALGVTLAIDDFGTGYSNLAYLRKIPARVLKLDRSFIRTLPETARDRTIVRSLIGMAHDLEYRVVAEGVETGETLDLLRDWGCDEAQGFLYARAMPKGQLPGWIAANTAATRVAA